MSLNQADWRIGWQFGEQSEMQLGQKVRRLWRVESWFLIEAILVLRCVRFGLRRLRYATLVRRLERSATWAGSRRARLLTTDLHIRILAAMSQVRRRHIHDFTCLEEALTIQWLLRRQGLNAQVRIGVVKTDDEQLMGHAWVECDGRIVSLDPVSPAHYVPLAPSALASQLSSNSGQSYAIHRGHLSV
jgi:hypothetical protein